MPPKRRAPPPSASTAPPPSKPRQSKLAKENNISAATEAEIHEAFSLFAVSDEAASNTKSKSAVIPTSDIRRALTALGAAPASAAELTDLLDTVDPDDEGVVGYANFVAIAALQISNRSEESQREEVEDAFRLFVGKARGGSGGDVRITLNDLKRVARELKEDVSEQVLRDMMLEANGGEGVGRGVSARDFEGVMRRAGVFR